MSVPPNEVGRRSKLRRRPAVRPRQPGTPHASACVTKPVDFTWFTDVVRRIDDFSSTIVRLAQS
ncbi:MAG TPA: hypothetical protein VFN68_06945 [Acidimicrobiales bacterium]|nr:hypothetical protein [Acidimicrobiales bacterium]